MNTECSFEMSQSDYLSTLRRIAEERNPSYTERKL